MNPPRRWLRRSLAFAAGALLLALVAAALAIHFSLRVGAPQRSGSLSVAGLSAPVDVLFDERAVPHLFASEAADLALALGWLHACERMAQMELARRYARGRLAELVGKDGLATDIRMRRLELARTAEAAVQHLAPESRAWLEAYAVGVNARLEQGGRDPLLRLLGVRPEPWSPADSLCLVLLMALELSTSFEGEFARLGLLASAGREALDALYAWDEAYLEPEHELLAEGLQRLVEGAPLTRALLQDSGSGEASPDASAPREIVPVGGGSNAWAVSGARSTGRGALLAGDPHLSLGLPSRWYQVRASSPQYDAQGFTLPGLPLIVIGQGPYRAWSLTTTGLDTEDTFVEDFDPRSATVRRGSRRVPVEARIEAIRVRGEGGRDVPMWRTELGPLFPADAARGLPPYSLAWTAHQPGDPVQLFLELARAPEPAAVWAAARDYVAPVQTLVVAEAMGSAHYGVVGAHPRRPRGSGRLPSPAWEASFHWTGRTAGDAGPRVEQPEGVVVSANADVRPDGWDAPFPADFAHPSRRDRLLAVLDQRVSWDLEQLAALQRDRSSPYAEALIAVLGDDWEGDAGRASAILQAWDARVEGGPGALLFQYTVRELVHGMGEHLLGQARHARTFYSPLRDALPRLLGPEGLPGEARRMLVGEALERAYLAAQRRAGYDPANWRLEAVQELELRHPLGDLPVIGRRLNRGPFGFAGHDSAVDVAWSRWRGEQLVALGAACLRFVADTADPDRSLAVQPGGQSGHPFDPHYADQLDAWREGTLHPLHWSRAAAEAAAVSRLSLLPADS
jgi:penicillin G amidase